MNSRFDACASRLRWLGEKLVKAIHLHELNTRLLVQKVLPEPLYDRILDARRPRVAVLMRQTHEPAVLIKQTVVYAPGIHPDADQFVLEERGSGGNAPLDLIEERGQVPVYVLAPPNGHVRESGAPLADSSRSPSNVPAMARPLSAPRSSARYVFPPPLMSLAGCRGRVPGTADSANRLHFLLLRHG